LKGKKFDAAEKHFQEKELKLRREMRQIAERMTEVSSINSQFAAKNKVLEKENAEIKERYRKLLEYSKLSESDITAALKRDKAVTQLAGLVDGMPFIIGGRGY
jgi:predicted nuclease with TOPRIM domain